MSTQAVEDFLQKFHADPALAQQVSALPSLQALVELAQTLGYRFLPSEYSAFVLEKYPEPVEQELADDDLAQASGGVDVPGVIKLSPPKFTGY